MPFWGYAVKYRVMCSCEDCAERVALLECGSGRRFWWGRFRGLLLAVAAAAILAALLFTAAA